MIQIFDQFRSTNKKQVAQGDDSEWWTDTIVPNLENKYVKQDRSNQELDFLGSGEK